MPVRVLEIELTEELIGRDDLAGYTEALVLTRHRGRPLGILRVPCPDGRLEAPRLEAALGARPEIVERLADEALTAWLLRHAPAAEPPAPSWSVVVCTRDRPQALARCLASLQAARQPAGGEIIVVDNAPTSDATATVVAGSAARYVREDRIGLNWARTRGARVAAGEVLAFTDDDVVVDRDWIVSILRPFAERRVAAVTGLTMPLELETEAQQLFERYGGFVRGFAPRVFDYTNIRPPAAGVVGAGANMAIRRALVDRLRLFEAELDCGTVARTGGDTYAFYRLLADGYRIVYAPDALVWHEHRRDYADLRRTLHGYSVGGFAFLTRCLLRHGDCQAVPVAVSWVMHDHLRKLARSLLRRPGHLPLGLVLSYLAGCFVGPWAHFASRRRERRAAAPSSGPNRLETAHE